MIENEGMGARSAGVAAVETLDAFVGGCRQVVKRNPRVVVGGKVLPANEVVKTVAGLAAVEDVGNGVGGFVGKLERFRFSVGVEFGWVRVRLEE